MRSNIPKIYQQAAYIQVMKLVYLLLLLEYAKRLKEAEVYPAKEPSSAASITPAYKGGNKAVAPEDTQGTEEAPISVEISTLAQTLHWQPVEIYEYVKNSIETEWYYGCMKGAEETLRQKSGNDCDQATLLVALLRASGFPSRER